jgi:hypothetical protein
LNTEDMKKAMFILKKGLEKYNSWNIVSALFLKRWDYAYRNI